MKLVMDEKLKHRLIGLAVIISLGVIFVPALMRKSSQPFDKNLNVNVTLPPKPSAPNVALTEEKDMFKTIKIAKVRIPSVSQGSQLNEKVKAEPIQSASADPAPNKLLEKVQAQDTKAPMVLALNESVNSTVKKVIKSRVSTPVASHPVTVALKQKPVNKIKNNSVKNTKLAKHQNKPESVIYAVQLASFTHLNNAQSLVNRLHSRGFQAHFTKTVSKHGAVYKVYAGNSQRKIEAVKLKSQLASAMQLKGFVVNTGVS